MVKNDARVPAELECAFGSRLGKRNTRQYTLIAARAGKGVQIGTVLAPSLTLLVQIHFYRAVSCASDARISLTGAADSSCSRPLACYARTWHCRFGLADAGSQKAYTLKQHRILIRLAKQ